jgi:hypothetical protein
MHDGGVAVVGVGARGLALQGAHGAVWAGVAARGEDGGRLRAWGFGGAGRGREGTTARLAGLTRGRGGVVYMVRHIPSSLSSLQEWEGSSCSTHSRSQHGLQTSGWRGARDCTSADARFARPRRCAGVSWPL